MTCLLVSLFDRLLGIVSECDALSTMPKAKMFLPRVPAQYPSLPNLINNCRLFCAGLKCCQVIFGFDYVKGECGLGLPEDGRHKEPPRHQ